VFKTFSIALLSFLLLPVAAICALPADLRFETVQVDNGIAPVTLNLAYRPETNFPHPVILMLGSLQSNQLPAWSTNLVAEGYMLAAYTAAYPPDPDPGRRPQWLFFDQRFAHSYILGGHRAVSDSRIVIDHLVKRGDVARDKIGWLGSSSTGIPGLSVVTQGPRLLPLSAPAPTGNGSTPGARTASGAVTRMISGRRRRICLNSSTRFCMWTKCFRRPC
jgi:hypothetical protein